MFAVPCLNALAAEWLFCGWSNMRRFFRVSAALLCLLAFSSFLFSGVFYGGRGLLTAYRVAKGVPIMRTVPQYCLSQGEYEGLDWISRNTARDSVVASEKYWTDDNRDNEAGSARYFYYSVFGKRQMYLEGWAYSSWAYPDRPDSAEVRAELRRRLDLLDQLFGDGRNAERLMKQEGIDLILVDKMARPDFFSAGLKLLFENERVAVFALP